MPLLLSPSSPTVDAVMLEARAAGFAKRSIKNEAKLAAIDLAIRCIDLTTLEGRDSPGASAPCAPRHRIPPGPPRVAAVCVYPNLVAVAKEALRGTGVKVASVATAFPSGLSSLDVKLRDTQAALASGADEIDMVIDRGAFLAGDEQHVFDEIAAVKAVCGPIHLKAILETASSVRRRDPPRERSRLEAGADVIKTSTGKIGTLGDARNRAGDGRGDPRFRAPNRRAARLEVAGGVRDTKAAIAYLVLIDETLGEPWLSPEMFRIGASSLLDDLLLQRGKLATGRYGSLDYISKD